MLLLWPPMDEWFSLDCSLDCFQYIPLRQYILSSPVMVDTNIIHFSLASLLYRNIIKCFLQHFTNYMTTPNHILSIGVPTALSIYALARCMNSLYHYMCTVVVYKLHTVMWITMFIVLRVCGQQLAYGKVKSHYYCGSITGDLCKLPTVLATVVNIVYPIVG